MTLATLADLATLPTLPAGPDAEVWIAWLWRAVLTGGTLALAWLILFALDIVLFPRWTPSLWQRPLCWLFGHIEGQDFEVTEAGFFDICTRCGHRSPGEED